MAYAAIRTKFLGATNTRPARIKATLEDRPTRESILGRDIPGSATLPYDYALDQFPNHKRAAQALADKFFNTYVTQEEPVELVAGAVDRGYIWVRVHPNLVQLS